MAVLGNKFGCFYWCHQGDGPSESDNWETKSELF